MNQQIDAIYDNGVFKPLVPLALPDKARVKLSVDSESVPSVDFQELPKDQACDPAILAKQKAALEELRRAIDKLPQTKNNDGWSVRDHDKLLYDSNQ